jgi:hypothetical protein
VTFLADRVTNVPVSFRQLRMKDAEGGLQEGVVGANDLKIVQRAAGANQSVDFSVGAATSRSTAAPARGSRTSTTTPSRTSRSRQQRDEPAHRPGDRPLQRHEHPGGHGRQHADPGDPDWHRDRWRDARQPHRRRRSAERLPAPRGHPRPGDVDERDDGEHPGPAAVGARTSVTLPGVVAPGSELDTTNWKCRMECSGAPLRLSFGAASLTVLVGNTASVRFWMDGADVPNAVGIVNIVNNTTANLVEDATMAPDRPGRGHTSSRRRPVSGRYRESVGETFVVEEIVRRTRAIRSGRPPAAREAPAIAPLRRAERVDVRAST